jgi:hypothetical protein
LPRPIFDLSIGSGSKTIAHHADVRQMANQEMKRSFPDPCGAVRARMRIQNVRRGALVTGASMRGWPAQIVISEIGRLLARQGPGALKIESKIMWL